MLQNAPGEGGILTRNSHNHVDFAFSERTIFLTHEETSLAILI